MTKFVKLEELVDGECRSIYVNPALVIRVTAGSADGCEIVLADGRRCRIAAAAVDVVAKLQE